MSQETQRKYSSYYIQYLIAQLLSTQTFYCLESCHRSILLFHGGFFVRLDASFFPTPKEWQWAKGCYKQHL